MGTHRPNPSRAAPRLRSLLLLLVLASLLLPSSIAVPPTEDEWPQFRGWDARVGTSPSSIPATNETLWSLDLPDQVQSSFAIVDGRALVGCDDGNLYCLDADTGEELWTFWTSNTVQSSPLVSDGRVYFGSSDGRGYCLDLENGTVVWSHEGKQIVASPALWNGMVYFADQWGGLCAVDADTGEEVWNDTFPMDLWASPTVVAGGLYLGDIAGNFRCYDATSGEMLWDRAWPGGEIYSTACVHDGRVLVGTGIQGTLECLDITNGDTIWTFDTYNETLDHANEIYSSASVLDGVVYIHSWRWLWAVPWDDADGTIDLTEVLWRFRTHDEQGGSSPIVSGDNLVVGSDNGRLYCVHTANGTEIWNLSLPGFIYSSPAVALGRVYIGSMDSVRWREGYHGTVVCVGSPSQPRVYTTLVPSQTTCHAGQSITLDVSVLDADGQPGGDAFMQYTATHGELFATFGTVVEGAFKNYWTAPDVGTTTYVTISATGELPGVEVVGHEIIITVEPAEEPPPVDVPRVSHPYLLAGVTALLVIDILLAIAIARGRRRSREVAT